MAKYIFKRILGLFATLLLLSLVVFILMHSIPGGPFDLSGGEKGIAVPDAVRKEILKNAGLDKPLYQQYLIYVWNALHFDFGYSFYKPTQTVAELIGSTWRISAQLGILTFVGSTIIGILLGIASGLHQNSIVDYVVTFCSSLGTVFPNFVVAVILQFIICVKLKWLPTGGWGEPKHFILPVIAYALSPASEIARYTRTSILEILREDYVRTATAKGVTRKILVLRHILRNAIIPILTILGPIFSDVMTGSFYIESIFRVPGLGKYFVTSVPQRDYPMILGTTLLTAALMAVVNLITDILYGSLDPRIRIE